MMSYPLTTENGETILNETWLVRHIREHCGDAVADFTAEQLVVSVQTQVEEIATEIGELIRNLNVDMDEIQDALNGLTKCVTRMRNL